MPQNPHTRAGSHSAVSFTAIRDFGVRSICLYYIGITGSVKPQSWPWSRQTVSGSLFSLIHLIASLFEGGFSSSLPFRFRCFMILWHRAPAPFSVGPEPPSGFHSQRRSRWTGSDAWSNSGLDGGFVPGSLALLACYPIVNLLKTMTGND